MKAYYSHAMPLYGTNLEIIEKALIMKNLPNVELVDPGSFQDNIEKRIGGMEYCLKLVEKCDCLVFTRFLNKITAGVGKEVNHALIHSIPVHELKNNKLKKIKEPVVYLNRDETVMLYRKFNLLKQFLKKAPSI